MIELKVHSAGSCGMFPTHLWSADCANGSCQMTAEERAARATPGKLVGVNYAPHEHAQYDRDITIGNLSERMGVVEQILSDAIPLQPGEPGYEAVG